ANIPHEEGFGKNFVSSLGRGRGVGGSSLVMGSAAWFPFDGDYDDWQEETGVDWSKDALAGAREEARRVFNVGLQPPETLAFLRGAEMFRDAARSMGYEVVPGHQRAARNCIYCGHCGDRQLCKYDAKQSTLVTHAPVAERNGVEIIANARAEKVIIERAGGGRAVARGVVFRKLDLPDEFYPGDDYVDWSGAKQITILARKVIVSCGDLETPPLLFASGYGSKEDCGADLLVENRNVGHNIDGHYGEGGQIGVNAIFDEEVRTEDGLWQNDPWYHFTTHIGRNRIVIFNGYLPPTHSFWDGQPERLALHPAAPQFGREHKDFMRQIGNPWVKPGEASWKSRSMMRRLMRVAVSAKLPKGAPRGSIDRQSQVHIYGREVLKFSRETGKEERIYSDIQPDAKKLFGEAQQIAVEVLRKMGAKQIMPDPVPGPGGVVFKWITGGCRAGASPKDSVVNQNFESHDIDNLFVVDVGALPRSTTLGMFLTIGTVAIFAADRIVARHFARRA
ncbi:MAG: GMC family oxidoreductase N-terminal domain-containing protein, partial [Pyrinomonadaceae bacterium]